MKPDSCFSLKPLGRVQSIEGFLGGFETLIGGAGDRVGFDRGETVGFVSVASILTFEGGTYGVTVENEMSSSYISCLISNKGSLSSSAFISDRISLTDALRGDAERAGPADFETTDSYMSHIFFPTKHMTFGRFASIFRVR